jgi:murein DD-endopeptidase MepM/ murein hydrolase activator NlpD
MELPKILAMQLNWMRRLRHLLTALLLLGLVAAALPATADPQDRLEDIQRRQDELDRKIERAQQQKGRLLDQISVVDTKRGRVEAEVAELDDELATLNAHIEEVSARLERTQVQLAALEEELGTILARLVRRTDVFTERAVAAYKAGPTGYLDGLFGADSFGDLIEKYSYYEAVLEADSQMIDEINALRGETEQRRAQVQKKEEQIAADKRVLEEDRARVAALREERAGALAALERVLDDKRGLVAEVEARKSTYERAQDALERESNEIQALLASSAASAGAPSSYGGGQFAWPAPGPLISPYGYRVHPIFGDRRLHTGIDIGAPYGATVVAAEGGVVAYVGTMSGYGNVVVVDHGGGIATTYNHLSGFSVGSGQSVGRGQPIALVGCTGYCTGPHLHFEVRISGSPVDPMPYLR